MPPARERAPENANDTKRTSNFQRRGAEDAEFAEENLEPGKD